MGDGESFLFTYLTSLKGHTMFYQVKILNKDGSLKKVISSKSLSKKFWNTDKQGQEYYGNLKVEEGDFNYGKGSLNSDSSSTRPFSNFD